MVRDDSVPAQPFLERISGPARFLFRPTLGWMLFVYAALVLASGWAYSALRIRTDREQTLQTERNRLREVTAALEAGTLAMLSDGVGSAVAGANEIESSGGLRVAPASSVAATLSKVLTGGNYVRSIFLAEPARFVRAGRGGEFESLAAPPPWFTGLRRPAAAEAWVGTPIPDPDRPGAVVVPVARRLLTDTNGSLWTGALLDFRGFQSLHARLGGDATALGLVSTDGTILVRIPGVTAPRFSVGDNVASSVLFGRLASGPDAGLVEGFAPAFGTRMVFAYGRVSGYPMVMVTCESLDSILAPWHERTFTTLIVTTVSSVLVLLMTALLNHYVRALFRRELHFRALFNNSAFSVLMLEGHRFVDANDTVARMFGLKNQNAAIGRAPWEFSPERQPDGRLSRDAARDRIAEALREGGTTFEWVHKRIETGETFPAEVDLTSLSTGKTTLALAVVHDLTARKRAEQEWKESEHRYRALVDALPEAVFVHRGSDLLFVNHAGLKLIGAQSGEALTGLSVFSFAAEEDREIFLQRVREILEDGVQTEPRELRVRRMDGSFIWVESQGVRIMFGGAPAVQGVMHDVTARKRREAVEFARVDRMQRQSAALMQLANRYDSGWTDLESTLRAICAIAADVLEVDRVGIWLLEEGARTLRSSQLYERETGRYGEAVELATNRFPRYLETLRSQRVIESENLQGDARLAEIAAGQWLAPAARSIIAAAIRTSGELAGVVSFDQVAASRAWHMDEVTFAGGIADQIAQALLDWERERVLADLRGLAGELMRIQDEERRRVGRDLHDSTGQTLAALELDLARLTDSTQSLPPEQRNLLAECARLASLCSAEIRTASYLLHPPLLDELGLVSALRWLADGLRNRGGIEVRLALPDSIPRLRPEEELTLFRIAQEALTNAQRHSASPWVAVKLHRSANSIDLEIEDGGRGITGQDESRGAGAGPTLGVGLTGMRERMRQVGGAFSVESTGAGTRICASIPINSWPQARSA